jgi:hypothetical protein
VGAGNELLEGVRVWPGVRLEPTSVRFSSDALFSGGYTPTPQTPARLRFPP